MAAETIDAPCGCERPRAPRVERAHTSMSAASAALAGAGTLTFNQRDYLDMVKERIRNAQSVCRLAAASSMLCEEDAERTFWALSHLLGSLVADVDAFPTEGATA